MGNAGFDIGLALPRLPEHGESLLGTTRARDPGGKGLNQAVVAARAGARVELVAPIGDDAQGAEVAGRIGCEPFERLALMALPHPTDYSLLLVLPDGENAVIGAGPCAAAFPEIAAARACDALGHGDLLIVQGNLSRAATQASLESARARGAARLFNPSPLWWDATPLLSVCSIVIANRSEALALTGANSPEAALEGLAAFGIETAIVTLGAAGCLLHTGGVVHRLAAQPVAAIDTTGCGDTFAGVFAAMLMAHGDPLRAIDAAQRAAAVTASRPGAFAALPRRSELAALLKTA